MRPKEKREPSYIKGEVELVGVVRLSEKRAPFMPKNNPEKGSWFSRYIHSFFNRTVPVIAFNLYMFISRSRYNL